MTAADELGDARWRRRDVRAFRQRLLDAGGRCPCCGAGQAQPAQPGGLTWAGNRANTDWLGLEMRPALRALGLPHEQQEEQLLVAGSCRECGFALTFALTFDIGAVWPHSQDLLTHQSDEEQDSPE